MHTSPTQSPKHGLIIKPSQTQHSDLENDQATTYIADHKYFCFVFSSCFFRLQYVDMALNHGNPNSNPNRNSLPEIDHETSLTRMKSK